MKYRHVGLVTLNIPSVWKRSRSAEISPITESVEHLIHHLTWILDVLENLKRKDVVEHAVGNFASDLNSKRSVSEE